MQQENHKNRKRLTRVTGITAITVLGLMGHAAQAQLATDLDCTNCVGNQELGIAAVFKANIANATITGNKIAPEAIGTGKIKDSAITSGKLAGASVGTGKLKDGAVTGAKLSGSITIPAIGMHPLDETIEYLKQTGNGYVWLNGATTTGAFVAPVVLPAGAVITAVRCMCYDNEGTGLIQVRLVRNFWDSAGSSNTANIGVAATTAVDVPSTVLLSAEGLSETVLAGPEYSYFVEVFLDLNSSQLGFFVVTIEYGGA